MPNTIVEALLHAFWYQHILPDVHVFSATYGRALLSAATLTLSGEHCAADWFALNQLDRLFLPVWYRSLILRWAAHA